MLKQKSLNKVFNFIERKKGRKEGRKEGREGGKEQSKAFTLGASGTQKFQV